MAGSHPPSTYGGPASRRGRGTGVLAVGLAMLVGASAAAQDIEREPIRYGAATPRNAVSQLQERLARGTAKLEFEPKRGYLRSLLRRARCARVVAGAGLLQDEPAARPDLAQDPRAIYFNDDVMVGFCNRGRVMEISAADDLIGTAFYTIDQAAGKSAGHRAADRLVPALPQLVGQRGLPRAPRPFALRGPRGQSPARPRLVPDRSHQPAGRTLGRLVRHRHQRSAEAHGQRDLRRVGEARRIHDVSGVNVVDLKDRFRTSIYPTPHSDIVALMVLEHQAGMLNRLARAGMETRMALHYQREMNKALGQPDDEPSDSAQSRIRERRRRGRRVHALPRRGPPDRPRRGHVRRSRPTSPPAAPATRRAGRSATSTSRPGCSATRAAT